ncbi:MAG: hypothetical protein H7A46_11000 [Verrucomicrobiales bacterium]|nr:hypothetical protein [Verrucomicrobiales bacterium]
MEATFVLGPDPMATGEIAAPGTRPATLFLNRRVLVTLPGTHFTQALDFREHLDAARRRLGEEPWTDKEWAVEEAGAVALYYRGGCLELPTTRALLPQVLQADSILQQHFPKNRIRFLSVSNPAFLDAIRRQGGLWRVTPRPRRKQEMIEHIGRSRNAIGLEAVYLYNPHLGTRFLTCGSFVALADLPDDALAQQLEEVRSYLGRLNRQGEPELTLWPGPADETRRLILETIWLELDPVNLRAAHERVGGVFAAETPLPLRRDDSGEQSWVSGLFCSLVREPEAAVAQPHEEELGPEFIYQVRWLPGATFRRGECVLDSILDAHDNPEVAELRDEVAIKVIKNVAREYGDLEYINIGRIANRLRSDSPAPGRREVFLLDFKRTGAVRPDLRVIRFQKYDIRYHLREGAEIVNAILWAENYAEYIFDRRLGCRQLGMNLPWQFTRQHIPEDRPVEHRGQDRRQVWATYFERDFIRGTPSPELAESHFSRWAYAEAVARLLGAAAAVNLIVGRVIEEGEKISFDQGNEVLIGPDADSPPDELVFCHHEGSFGDYRTPLKEFADQYAEPVNRRAHLVVPQQRRFAEAYLAAFQGRFAEIQQEYRDDRGSFNRLFASLGRDPNGSFGKRWDEVLKRLDQSDPGEITRAIRRHIRVFTQPADESEGNPDAVPEVHLSSTG